jgi:hypothetical protein
MLGAGVVPALFGVAVWATRDTMLASRLLMVFWTIAYPPLLLPLRGNLPPFALAIACNGTYYATAASAFVAARRRLWLLAAIPLAWLCVRMLFS